MANSAEVLDDEPHSEKRAFERFDIDLPGRLFVPAQDDIVPCQVTNLSGSGARIWCKEPPPLLTYIVLYIEGFGRFEGVTARFVDDDLAIRFFCKEAESKRLTKDLMRFVNTGVKGATRLRRHTRSPGASSGYFVRPNGNKARCDILDISLQGLSLKTEVQPPVGEMISLGRYHGRVVRHHEEGFAIQFLEDTPSEDEFGD